jgi:hypothetical protein
MIFLFTISPVIVAQYVLVNVMTKFIFDNFSKPLIELVEKVSG